MSRPHELPVRLDAGSARARYALDALLRLLGLDAREAARGEPATIGYGAAPAAVRIPAGPPDGWDDPRPLLARDGALAVVHRPAGGTQALAAPTELGFDALYATYACLTGPWERDDPADEVGTPVAAEGWLARSGVLQEPLVHRYAAVLGDALRAAGVELPGQRPAAVVVTHDVDDNFAHLFGRRARWRLLRADPSARRAAGLARQLLVRPRADPSDRFDDWNEWHRAHGGRPTYFVASHGLLHGGDPRDVAYDVRHPAVRETLRRATAAGAELGVHLSLGARESAEQVRREREALEEAVGAPVRSARHHWWALGAPAERTLALHARAGLELDLSLGFNDRPGFRRGIALPFRPFDTEAERELDVWALPTIAMDAALYDGRTPPEEALERLRELWSTVSGIGGALVLDWHVHAADPAALPGAADGLHAFVAGLAGTPFRTPLELVAEREPR